MNERRRIDQVLSEDFTSDLDGIDLEDIRSRRVLAREVENELSYYRRLLHGRMDLLRFELRRRRGEETRSLLEALPEILADDAVAGAGPRSRHVVTDLPLIPDVGRREIDHLLGDDVLTRLDDIDVEGLEQALDDLGSMEAEVSERRRQVQQVEDLLTSRIAERYRSGPVDPVTS